MSRWTVAAAITPTLLASMLVASTPVSAEDLIINEVAVFVDARDRGTASFVLGGPLPAGDYFGVGELSSREGGAGIWVRAEIEENGTSLVLGLCPLDSISSCKPFGSRVEGVFDISLALSSPLAENETLLVEGQAISHAFPNVAGVHAQVSFFDLSGLPVLSSFYFNNSSPSQAEFSNFQGPLTSIQLRVIAEIKQGVVALSFSKVEHTPACDDGIDNDGDGFTDFNPVLEISDPGCLDAGDTSEHSASLPCDDGVNNDDDPFVDMDDPGCLNPSWPAEDPACQDGIDNDGDNMIDFDGGASVWGVSIVDPDPRCEGSPYRQSEFFARCGLGFELVFLSPLLARLRRAGKR